MSKYYDDFKTKSDSLLATPNYHKANAFKLALFAKLAYEKQRKARAQARRWGFNRSVLLDIQKGKDIHTQCLVSANSTDIVVAFRGSEAKKEDWLSNLQAVREAGPLLGTKAHEGFQDALYPVAVGLANTIDEFKNNDQKLWFTGHSLGGALASLAAGVMAENNYPIFGLYTFASPRPGDKVFAEQLGEAIEGPHYRVVNSLDVVPHVPPEPFFSHPGNRKILKQEETKDDSDSWWDERVKVLRAFVDRSMNALDIASNHVLEVDDDEEDDKQAYLYRLLADLNRDA